MSTEYGERSGCPNEKHLSLDETAPSTRARWPRCPGAGLLSKVQSGNWRSPLSLNLISGNAALPSTANRHFSADNELRIRRDRRFAMQSRRNSVRRAGNGAPETSNRFPGPGLTEFRADKDGIAAAAARSLIRPGQIFRGDWPTTF
ncbi:hypothetical protein GWI33_002462 [Rhynchophorus ferrugineus]|uniref:Uncharacterized protein n=1 Tax=Rhynchophorus ferrugineus TaxID=354439 RepID=A0A834IZE0_RHYFE|nr:hypothetical protein GWI33_002462 [Rhynchophorus ferrugineus]